MKGVCMMKKYRITVNGKNYEVEVEELGAGSAQNTPVVATVPEIQISQDKPKTPAPTPAPAAPAAAPKPKKSAPAGKISITSPMPGTILSIKVKPGANVSKGDVIMILEAMKMENEILAPEDGVISSIEISEGASVNTGDLLAVMG